MILNKFRNSTLAKAGLAYTIANGLQKGIGFFVFMYFASIMTATEYSEFGIYYSLFAIAGALASAGIFEAIVGFIKEGNNKKVQNVIGNANTVFLAQSLFFFILIYLILLIFFNAYYRRSTDIFIILFSAFQLGYFTFRAVVVRLDENHFFSIILSFVPAVLGYILGFLLTVIFKNSISFFEGTLIAQTGFIIIWLAAFKQKLGFFLFEKAIFFSIITKSIPFIVIALLAWILGYGNTFVIKYFFEDFQIALFIFLFTIASIIQLIATSMNQVWSPRFYNLYGITSSIELESKYRKFTILQGAILGICGSIIIILVPISSYFFEGLSKYSSSSFEMLMLFSGYIVSIPWWQTQNYFMINDKGQELMNYTLISGVLGFLVWIILMYYLGPPGIYIGFFIQNLLKSLLVYFKARSLWKLRFQWEGMVIGCLILGLTFFSIRFFL